MLEELRNKVWKANLDLVRYGLVKLTWGNVSGLDRESGLVVIKPSGVDYSQLKAEDLVILDLDGKVVEGSLRPSSDTPTHLELYRAFPEIGGVVHTHSCQATSWAQACRPIPLLGTTHADCFSSDIPCTPDMSESEIMGEYELNTGKIIVRTFRESSLKAMEVPACLVANHGPFVWGADCMKAVENSLVLEEIAKMAMLTLQINPEATMNPLLTQKHYMRKHGPNAYYGQESPELKA